MRMIEKFFWILLIFLQITRIAVGLNFLAILLVGVLLAFMYLICSVFLLNGIKVRALFGKAKLPISRKQRAGSLVTGLCYAVVAIGIVFKLVGFAAADSLLAELLVFLVIHLLICRYMRREHPETILYRNTYQRSLIFAIVCAVLLSTLLLPKAIRNKVLPPFETTTDYQPTHTLHG